VRLAEKACELVSHDVCWSVLAAAHAECGSFERAIEYQEKAIELADEEAKTEHRNRLAEYKAKQPWRQ
jgi:Cdc6-like AAA superfamily ATPase